ncbi:collagen alpha-5(VI) chain-like isoform X2 [Pomacea canaliculata]|uniref:collagen alpha-5(VI) chain-like isoform X2 n=1 Tax=Pomacea canaliculata TaxID=400727 RepID=UPI000D73D231|nr:collagen alpha-5(VI) chain-like isoform X2 [Pomacea canaliculata]
MSLPKLLLPLFLFSQVIVANPSYRELEELADLLAVEKRLLLANTDDDDFITVCTQEPIELALVIDASSSIHPRDFQLGQQFLHEFLNQYDIGPGRNQVRVAAVTFGYEVYVNDAFYLNSFKTKEEVLNAVQNMPFRAGLRTDTGDAIKFMREKQMVKTRAWAPKFAVVLTDGNSQRTEYTKQQAALARAENITMFALGVGKAVKEQELLNIAGDPSRVLRADSYSELDEEKRKELTKQTCVSKPKPTTTTTTTTTTTPPPPMEEPCSIKYPSDINFIFSPAALGVDATGWVTQFISHTITNEELENSFQYGVVSGDCPDDEGFRLNQYTDIPSIRARLDRYDRNNLPNLIRSASNKFSASNGGRTDAVKVAVIFLGNAKVDSKYLDSSIQELLASGVQVFVSRTDPGIRVNLPPSVRLLEEGSSISQATELVSHICHLDDKEW